MRKKLNIRRDIESRRNIAQTVLPTADEPKANPNPEPEKPSVDEIKPAPTKAQETDAPPAAAPTASKAKKGGRETNGDA